MKVFKMVDNKNSRYLITADSITDLTKYVDETKASDGWVAGCIGQVKYEDNEPLLIGWMTMVKAKNIRRIDNIKEQQFTIDIKKAFNEEC